MKKTLMVLMMLLLSAMLIVSCNNSSKKVYTVTFNSNGGSGVDAVELKEGEKVPKPADPAKDGFLFDKWTTDEDGTKEYNFDTDVTANITLYAQWSNFFTVTFNSKEGSKVDPLKVKEGSTATKPDAPTREGFDFLAWSLDESAVESSYTEYSFDTPVTDNITLYAVWGVKVLTVTFNSNGGTSVNSAEVKYGEKATKPTPDPTKDRVIFDKWTTDEAGTQEYDFNTVVKYNITIYAQWRDYKVGDIGPAGGYVFYAKDSYSDGWRYLEAAPSDLNSTTKFSESKITDVTTDTAIGKGYQNTEALAQKGAAAALACKNITTNAPWFLPSKDELVAMHKNLYTDNLGGDDAKKTFKVGSYWTSSIDYTNDYYNYVYIQVFGGDNTIISVYQSQPFNVRPVRRF